MVTTRFYELEQEGDTLVVCLLGKLGTFSEDEAYQQWEELFPRIKQTGAKYVVLDLTELSYFGSALLELIVSLGKHVRQRGGKIALCGASDHAHEILHVARIDSLWPLVATREKAMQVVRGED